VIEKCASEMICTTADLTWHGQALGGEILGGFGVGIVSACFIANSVKKHHNIHIIKEFLLVDSSPRIAGPAHANWLFAANTRATNLALGLKRAHKHVPTYPAPSLSAEVVPRMVRKRP
jgi:hypothetical protein